MNRALKRPIGVGVAALVGLGAISVTLPAAAQAASSLTISRVSGSDRYTTANVASSNVFPAGQSQTVVLASGTSTVDALASAYVAGAYNAPVLLTQPGSVSAETLAELKRLGATRVILAGGTAAINTAVEAQLSGFTVERAAGKDRYETSALLAAKVTNTNPTVVFVASSAADAAAVSPISAAKGWPVLLTDPNTASPSAIEALAKYPNAKVVALGGERAISAEVASQLKVTARLQGADRTSTAVSIANYALTEAGFTGTGFGLAKGFNGANGNDLADALTAGAVLAKSQSPLLLTESSGSAGVATQKFLTDNAARFTGQAYVFGGEAAVSTGVVNSVATSTGGTVKPLVPVTPPATGGGGGGGTVAPPVTQAATYLASGSGVAGNKVTLKFSGDLNSSVEVPASAFSVMVGSTPIRVTDADIAGSIVTLTLATSLPRSSGEVVVSYSKPALQPLTDTNYLEVADFSTDSLTNTTQYVIAKMTDVALVTSGVLTKVDEGDQFVLRYTEPVDFNSAVTLKSPGMDSVRLFDGIGGNAEFASADDGRTVVVTVLNGSADFDPEAFAITATEGIVDPALEDEETEVTTPLVTDVVKPQVVSQSVNGQTVWIKFSEPLDPGQRPSADSFLVSAGNGPVPVSSVTVFGDTVSLTIDRKVTSTEVVQVAYTSGGQLNALQDRAIVPNLVDSTLLAPAVNETPATASEALAAATALVDAAEDKVTEAEEAIQGVDSQESAETALALATTALEDATRADTRARQVRNPALVARSVDVLERATQVKQEAEQVAGEQQVLADATAAVATAQADVTTAQNALGAVEDEASAAAATTAAAAAAASASAAVEAAAKTNDGSLKTAAAAARADADRAVADAGKLSDAAGAVSAANTAVANAMSTLEAVVDVESAEAAVTSADDAQTAAQAAVMASEATANEGFQESAAGAADAAEAAQSEAGKLRAVATKVANAQTAVAAAGSESAAASDVQAAEAAVDSATAAKTLADQAKAAADDDGNPALVASAEAAVAAAAAAQTEASRVVTAATDVAAAESAVNEANATAGSASSSADATAAVTAADNAETAAATAKMSADSTSNAGLKARADQSVTNAASAKTEADLVVTAVAKIEAAATAKVDAETALEDVEDVASAESAVEAATAFEAAAGEATTAAELTQNVGLKERAGELAESVEVITTAADAALTTQERTPRSSGATFTDGGENDGNAAAFDGAGDTVRITFDKALAPVEMPSVTIGGVTLTDANATFTVESESTLVVTWKATAVIETISGKPVTALAGVTSTTGEAAVLADGLVVGE